MCCDVPISCENISVLVPCGVRPGGSGSTTVPRGGAGRVVFLLLLLGRPNLGRAPPRVPIRIGGSPARSYCARGRREGKGKKRGFYIISAFASFVFAIFRSERTKLANLPKVRCPPLAAPASFAPTKQTKRKPSGVPFCVVADRGGAGEAC